MSAHARVRTWAQLGSPDLVPPVAARARKVEPARRRRAETCCEECGEPTVHGPRCLVCRAAGLVDRTLPLRPAIRPENTAPLGPFRSAGAGGPR